MNRSQVAAVLVGDANSPSWTIISPDVYGTTQEAKEHDRKWLEKLLAGKGHTVLKVDGYYNGSRERSYLVVGMHSYDACRLAVYLCQDAYLTKAGLFYRGVSGWYERSNIRGLTVSTIVDDTSDQDRSIIYCSDGLITFTAVVEGQPLVEQEVKIELPSKSTAGSVLAEHLF